MGLFPTLYAHWRLNTMLRVWRKANKVMTKLTSFVQVHGTAKQYEVFKESLKSLDVIIDDVVKTVEDFTISELKERV